MQAAPILLSHPTSLGRAKVLRLPGLSEPQLPKLGGLPLAPHPGLPHCLNCSSLPFCLSYRTHSERGPVVLLHDIAQVTRHGLSPPDFIS